MNKTRRNIAAGAAALVFAAVAVVGVRLTDTPKTGVFYSACQLDHSAPDDPIVFPGQPGASHLHDFAGLKGINAFTEPAPTAGQPTTCKVPGDSAGYWVPALYVDGVKIDPVFMNARYSTGGKGADVQAFPPGLKMVAGPGKHAGWSCNPGTSKTAPLGCPDKAKYSTAVIHFPDCWNGRDLDSADHRSHMSYTVRGVCPATHPVPMVSLTLKVSYPKQPATGTAEASSGTLPTLHADFLNSWNQDRFEELVQNCVRTQIAQGTQCKKEQA